MLFSLYRWGIPLVATIVTPYVPISWEKQLGAGVVRQLASPKDRCTHSEGTRAIQSIFTRLIAPLQKGPYSFQVIVVDKPIVNAFAAPGGYIVLFRGLVERSESAEELAAVLAHEAQHILKRHTTKALLKRASARILLSALSGDAVGMANFGWETTYTLGMLEYDRRAESEADQEGVRMLTAAHIDPVGMVTFFESLKVKQPDLPDFLQYLSTHPGTAERVDRVKSLLKKTAPPSSPKLFTHEEWNKIRKVC
jgi:predicted Zn-dependent protease